MIISAETLRRLAELLAELTHLELPPGVTERVIQMIAEILAADEIGRRVERERKQAYRAGRKDCPGDGPGDSPGSPRDRKPAAAAKKVPPHPPKEIPSTEASHLTARNGRFPTEIATADAVAFARDEMSWPIARIDVEWEKFRDWHLATGTRRKDVLAAWRNWCRSPFQQEDKPHGRSPKSAAPKSASETARALIEQLEQRERAGRGDLFSPDGPLRGHPRDRDDA